MCFYSKAKERKKNFIEVGVVLLFINKASHAINEWIVSGKNQLANDSKLFVHHEIFKYNVERKETKTSRSNKEISEGFLAVKHNSVFFSILIQFFSFLFEFFFQKFFLDLIFRGSLLGGMSFLSLFFALYCKISQ